MRDRRPLCSGHYSIAVTTPGHLARTFSDVHATLPFVPVAEPTNPERNDRRDKDVQPRAGRQVRLPVQPHQQA